MGAEPRQLMKNIFDVTFFKFYIIATHLKSDMGATVILCIFD